MAQRRNLALHLVQNLGHDPKGSNPVLSHSATEVIDISELTNMRPRGRARGRVRHEPGKMNRLEAEYSAFLCGVFHRFESIKFRLADKTYYTPDFMVMQTDGSIEFHEVKGFWEDDARVKVKVFAEMYPEFVVKAITKQKGQWHVEVIG